MKFFSQPCCLCMIAVVIVMVQSRRQLRYALFTSGPESDFDASGSVPAMELAEEYLLNASLLRDYELRHSPVQDTLCNRTRSLNLFFATVAQATPPVLGLLGCGCSVASEPVAEIIHHWNISQVAYDSSAIVLSEPRFVNFFRTYPSDASFAPAIVSFVQFYGWKQVLFITEEAELFMGVYENLSQMLRRMNITARNRVVPPTVPMLKQALKKRTNFIFTKEDIRVIFINTYSDVARIILCEAMMMHDFLVGYPRYVWITYAWYEDEWWTSDINNDPISCDENELAQMLRQSLSVEIVPVPDDPNAETDVGVTAAEFDDLYQESLTTPAAQENNYTFTFVAPIAYDTVWSFALALNSTEAMLRWPKERIIRETNCEDDGKDLNGFRLDEFTYNHTFIGCLIRWNLARTDFTGVSGRVSFDSSGTREQAQVTMLQYRSQSSSNTSAITRVRFARTNSVTFEYAENETTDTVFPDGVPPDGTPIKVVSTFHLALVVIYDILASLGIIFTTVCFVFNFGYRNRKVVRLTSPNLNYFIIVGSYIMYVSIIIRLIPSVDETVNYVICNLEVLLTTLAYCFAFGTVLVKVGRVYHIFNNPTEKKKTPLKDWHMATIVLGITAVGVLFAILGWSIPQLQAVPMQYPDEEKKTGRNELNVRIMYMVWQCSTNAITDIVSIVVFVYLGLLQLIGIILAIQTRKVKVKVLNDSKYIAALVYISSIVIVIIAIIRFTLTGYINVAEVFYSGGLILATTAFLCLTFIPKMVSLYKDPLGEKIFSHHSSTIEVGRSGALSIRKKADRVLELEVKVRELEELLRENKGNESKHADMDQRSVITDTSCDLVSSDEKQKANSRADHVSLNDLSDCAGQENGKMSGSTHLVTAV